MKRALAFFAVVAAAVAATTMLSASAPAEPGNDCGLTAIGGDGTTGCLDAALEAAAPAPAPQALPPATCRLPLRFVTWTASNWALLGQALADDPAPCGEYWVSIPPLAANKTGLRVLQDDVIRALAPTIHPVAEVTLGSKTGWALWVLNNHKTWYEAGVEFRKRMAAAGYDGTRGETWLLNELDRSTMRDAARTAPDQMAGTELLPPYRRADMEDLLRGLYEGAPGMAPMPGIVEYGIHFRHQNIPDVPAYKAELKSFLEDGGFWSTIDPYVRFFTVEAYPDVRYWAVPGSSRSDRRDHLADYVFHVLDLARGGPSSVDAARTFMERTYTPLLNSGWRARGGDRFDFVTGHGNTIVDIATMEEFVSEQVLAVRHYAGAHTRGAPAGRIGFSFEPVNRLSADDPSEPAWTPEFRAQVGDLVAHIAQSVRDSYAQGGSSPVGACGDANEWCRASLAGAAFTEGWAGFGSW